MCGLKDIPGMIYDRKANLLKGRKRQLGVTETEALQFICEPNLGKRLASSKTKSCSLHNDELPTIQLCKSLI